MPETDIRTLVSLEADQSGVDGARRALKQVEKDQRELVDAFKRGEVEAKDYNKQLRAMEANEKDLKRAIDSVTGEFTEQARAIREAADATAELAREQAELSTAQGNFDRVSADVSLLGDTESGVRTIGGAFSAFGAEGVGQALSASGELLAVAESLPKLAAAAKGIPGALKAAVSAIGVGGLAASGGLALALIGLNLVMKTLARNAEKAAAIERARNEAIIAADQFAATGGTTEAAIKNTEALDEQLQGFTKTMARFKDEAIDIQAEINRLDLFRERGIFSDRNLIQAREENRTSQIDLEAQISKTTVAIDEYNIMIGNNELAANDAAAAERELVAERTQGVLSSAQTAATLTRARQEAEELDRDAALARVESLKDQTEVIKAQLSSLRASGDTSEQVTGQISQLENSLSTLAQETDIFRKAAQTAAPAAKELADATTALGKAAQTQRQFKQTGIAFTASAFGLLGTNPAETAAKKKEAEEIAKQFRELEKDAAAREMDLRKDLAEQRFQLQLSEFRDTMDSIRDFSRSRGDALEEGRFLELRNINKEERRAAEDRKIDVRRGNKDINREGERSRRELQAQTANSMRELNAEVNRGLQAVVNQFQNALASIAGTEQAPRVPFGVSLFASAPRSS